MKLPQTGTLDRIDQALLAKKEKKRNYLGCSLIGDECNRKIFYELHFPSTFPARTQRIFDMGNIIEDYIISLLKKAGFTVYEKDENGEQFGFTLLDGKVAGHVDGIITGIPESTKPHLLEIKSSKSTIYKQFVKNGVKKQSSRYYGQMQLYMGAMNLDRALFIMMNKDTQELYKERIEFCIFEYECLKNKAQDILDCNTIPERAYSSKDFFLCKFCSNRNRCWELE